MTEGQHIAQNTPIT